jgi:hypothetical protein
MPNTNHGRTIAALSLTFSVFALPALAQTTTTVTTEPPPPQAAPPPASTQVVVNPPQNTAAYQQPDPQPPVIVHEAPVVVHDPPPPVVVRDDTPSVQAVPSGRSAVGIVALDAVYGGVAGGLVGGGVTLIDQGNNWGRDLMVGAGVGVLVGAAYGIYEAATQPPPVRAFADRNGAASDVLGVAPAQYAMRF